MRQLGQGFASGEESAALFLGLRAFDLFAPLSDEHLRKVLYFVKLVEFEAGETVFEMDSSGDLFFLIQSGAVEAFEPGYFGPKVLSRMGPGDFFGELALILSRPRSAGVRCVEPTVCFTLDRTDLETLMERSPDVAEAIKKIAQKRFAGQ
jgi:CRP-like cAMP-binding protein